MTQKEVKEIGHGLFRVFWNPANGGGSSLASVGSDSTGRRWFAPINWIEVPSFDWGAIDHVEEIEGTR